MASSSRRSSANGLRRAGVRPHRLPVVSIVLLLAALLLRVSPGAAHAASVLQVENSSATAGGTGSFDVVYTNTGTLAQTVSGFSVQLSIASGAGVSFTGVNVSTTAAGYIFTTLQSPPLTFNTFPNLGFIAADSYLSAPGYVTVGAGQTVGLEHVLYSVASGTHSGPVTVSFVTGSNTALFDLNSNLIPIVANSGTIAVGGASVPAPPSLLMGFIAAGFLVAWASRRQSRPLWRCCRLIG